MSLRPKKPIDEFFGHDIVVNEEGGGQSEVRFRFDLVDPYAMFMLAKVLQEGARRYAPDNWRLIDCHTHVNHGIGHAIAFLHSGSDEELSHAFTRFMMAMATSGQQNDTQEPIPDPKPLEARCRRD